MKREHHPMRFHRAAQSKAGGLLGLMLALASSADAITTSWTGSHDSNWADSRNWTSGVPGSLDHAVVNSGYVASASDRSVASLSVGGGTVVVPNLSAGTLNLSGGRLQTTSAIVSSAATWTGGEIGGAITIPSGVTLAIPSGAVRLLTSATLTNSGTVEMSGGQIEGYDLAVIHNYGTWSLTGHETPFFNFYWTNTFHNHGLLRKAGTTPVIHLDHGWTYQLDGETRCETGELRLAQNHHYLPDGAQLTGAGTIRLASGTIHLTGVVHETVGTLVLDGATLDATGTAAVSGTLAWNSGFIQGSHTIPATSRLEVSGDGFKQMKTGVTLTNYGTVEMSGGRIEGYELVNIHNHGTWRLAGHESPFFGFYWTNHFYNHGLLTKSGGAATILLNNGWTYHHVGETRCETGELHFAVTQHYLPAGAQLTGAGTIRLVSGTTHLEGQITETVGSLILDGATLNASGPAAVTGTLDWASGSLTGILGIPSGSRMEVYGAGSKRMNTAAEIVVSGTYRWTGPEPVEGYDLCRFRIQAGGVCDLAADGDPFNRFYDTNECINEGTLVKSAGSGGSTVCNDWTYRQRGNVQCEIPTLEFTSTVVFENTSSVTGTGNVLIRGTTHLPGAVTFLAPSSWTGGAWIGSGGSISGLLLWSGGDSHGDWQITPGSTLRVIDGTGTLKRFVSSAAIQCAGTFEMASGTLEGYENARIRILSGGLFSATGTALMTEFYGGTNHIEIQPGGQFATQTGAALQIDWRLDNAGTVRTPAGRLTCNDGGVSSGLFESTGSGALHFISGTHTLAAGAEIRGPGEVKLSGGALDATAPVEAFVHIAGGTAQGTGDYGELRFKQGSQWTSGILAGRTRVIAGATFAVSGPPETTRQMNTLASLAIDGRLLWQGPGPILGYDRSAIEIAAAGVMELTGDGEVFSQYYGANQLINHGTLRRSTSAGDATLRYFACLNDGTIETAAGRLVFQTPLTLAHGGVISGSGRTVCTSGTTTLLGTTQVAASTFELAGATLYSNPADNGTLAGGTVEWSAGFISGKITLNGIATTTGTGFRRLNSSAELRNAGLLTLAGGGVIEGYELSTLRNLPGATLHATGQVRLTRFYSNNSVVNEGTMTIGSSPGRMIIDSPFAQTASGRLEVGVAGPTTAAPDFDILQINASATIAGTLAANLEGGYSPAAGTTFEILTSQSRSGVFDQVVAPHFVASYPTTGSPPVSKNNVVLTATDGSELDLATWAAAHNLTGDDALADADSDGDGSPNLVEYALNMNPNQPDTAPVTSGIESHSGGDWLVLHYRRWQDRVNAGLVYQPAASTNLAAWSSAGIIDEPDPQAPVINGSEARRCRVQKNGGRSFLRLAFGLPD
jgi:hypothetical protein